MRSFTQELVLTIVDSLVIGALLVLAGFLVNLGLERYKSRDAFLKELAKTRVERIASVWSSLYEYESVIDDLISKTGELKLRQGGYMEREEFAYDDDELEAQARELSETSSARRKHIEDLLERERFWLGATLYDRCGSYFALQRNRVRLFFEIFMTEDETELSRIQAEYEQAQKEAEEGRRDVLSVLEDLEARPDVARRRQ